MLNGIFKQNGLKRYLRLTHIIAITNQKGGVGKTTTCVNLAASLAQFDRRVLLIDLDPQGNATTGSGIDKYNISSSVSQVLTNEHSIAEAIVTTNIGYDLLPATSDLTVAEVRLNDLDQKETQLKVALKSIRKRYDYILMDCPPALNLLTINALVSADNVLIPMQCEYYALEGLSALVNTINQLNKQANPKLHIRGILRTMYDPRISLAKEVGRQLIRHFGNVVYRTIIPRNVKLAEAPSHGLPALIYAKKSRGALSYLALAREIIRRERSLIRKIEIKKSLKNSTKHKKTQDAQKRTKVDI